MQRPDVLGIAIVNYRTAHQVAGLVHSVADRSTRTGPHVAVAIVDNSEQQPELAAVVDFARNSGMSSRLISGHGNVGYAAGNNLAASWLIDAGADVIWVLNPDTRIAGGTLASAMGHWPADGRGIAATTTVTAGGEKLPGLGVLDLWTGRSGLPAGGATPAAGKLTYVSGHSVLVTRRAWEDLAGFCEDYFLFYEEADLAVRSARLAIPTTVIDDLAVEHVGGATTGASRDLRAKSVLTYFHASRSCMIFFRKHHLGRVPLVAAARLAYAGRALVVAGGAAAAAIVRGVVAGLRA
ncbi:MAG TPA: glycosyltransferase [Micromonosporaceae bacterium]|nr:glycosyltransferase [Micromonosporaceae bacterium]